MPNNHILCPGDACPLRWTCYRWQNWLNNEDDDAEEMLPDYHNGGCRSYEQKTFTDNETRFLRELPTLLDTGLPSIPNTDSGVFSDTMLLRKP